MSQNRFDNCGKPPEGANTFSLGHGLSIYTTEEINNAITVTNNKTYYNARLAKKYKDEAKTYRDEAKSYAEENTNITFEQISNLQTLLEGKIAQKQNAGDYALKSELPDSVSDLTNDAQYVTSSAVSSMMSTLLPAQTGNGGKFLQTDGEALSWKHCSKFNIFDIKLSDHVLTGDEAKGYALQGTYVYKTSAAEHYGYPDFYSTCISEKAAGTETQTTLGESTITTYNNPNGHVFYNIADKAVVDAYYASTGECWMYGIDTENERIFMPRKKLYKNMPKTEIPVVGNGKVLGFSDGSGNYGLIGYAGNVGVIARTFEASNPPEIGAAASGSNPPSNNFGGVSPSSEVSGLIAKTDTLLEEDTTCWLYICVGNTEVESAVTDVVEVTTSTNDTVPLFTGQYFDFKPNSPSWLKAGEQANSGGIYTSCYNTLVNCLTEANNIYNLKVIETSEMVAGTDYSEYWKINQDETYFITPTKLSYKALNGKVKGTGNTLGLTDIANDLYLINASSGGGYGILQPRKNSPTDAGNSSVGTAFTATKTIGINTDSSKSGIVAEEGTAQLYFKVANAVQNLEMLDAGEVLETLTDKVDLDGSNASFVHIVETYSNGNSWYRVYSDGWCEQGGVATANPVSFMKQYSTAPNVISTLHSSSGGYGRHTNNVTTINFTTANAPTTSSPVVWEAKGYIN